MERFPVRGISDRLDELADHGGLNNIAGSMVVPYSQQMAGAFKGRLDQA